MDAFHFILNLFNPLKWLGFFFGLVSKEDAELNQYADSLDPAEGIE